MLRGFLGGTMMSLYTVVYVVADAVFEVGKLILVLIVANMVKMKTHYLFAETQLVLSNPLHFEESLLLAFF